MNDNPQNATQHLVPLIDQKGRTSIYSYIDRMRWAYAIVFLAMQTISLTVEVFLRQKFGERYLDPLMAMLGYGLLMFAAFSGFVGGKQWMLLVYAQLYLAFVLLHKLSTFHRNLKGERWHSYSEGISHRILTIPAILAARLVGALVPVRFLGEGYKQRLSAWMRELAHLRFEPVLVMIVGGLTMQADEVFGLYLFWAGLAMAFKNELKRLDDRRDVLNLLDQTIEATHQRDAAMGLKEPEEAEGFRVYGTPLSAGEQKTIASAYANLDPKLQELVGEAA